MNVWFARWQTALTGGPSPSPRPSPLGRGGIASRSGIGRDALVCVETRVPWLPLPKGEGRGEGEQDVSYRDPSNARRFATFGPESLWDSPPDWRSMNPASLSWRWYRLRAMSLPEIGGHLQKKIYQFSDARPRGDWAAVPLPTEPYFPKLPGSAAAPAVLVEA